MKYTLIFFGFIVSILCIVLVILFKNPTLTKRYFDAPDTLRIDTGDRSIFIEFGEKRWIVISPPNDQ